MAQPRRSLRIDDNQKEIVKKLSMTQGVSVALNHDDILVGYKGKNYWFEIKNPVRCRDKNGMLKKDALKKSQIDILRTWKGQYHVVFSYDEIMEILEGYKRG